MNDKRELPKLPPKANSVTDVSEAIRGAAQHAFTSRPTTLSNNLSVPKTSSLSARSAAAAAGGARKPALVHASVQNATNTTSASFAAYARGRPPPGIDRPSNAGILFGPTLSPMGQSRARERPSAGGSPAQAAARMASKSRSPARRTAYLDSPIDKPPLPTLPPQDQSAMLAGKLASLRSHQDKSGSPSPQSQTSTPPGEPPVLNMKQMPHLPKNTQVKPLQDSNSGKLAGAAAALAAVKHAQPYAPAANPRVELSREDISFASQETLSPDRSNSGGSVEAVSTTSTFASPIESEGNFIAEERGRTITSPARSAPIPITRNLRRSPVSMVSSNGASITDYRTGMTDRSLADAIVASSLASSRAASPTKVDLSVKPLRRSRSHSHTHMPLLPHHFLHMEKTADLPTKSSHAAPRALKQTLRKQSNQKEEDEEDTNKRGRKHFMRKHPHKHHEGDRKRWRDMVTERERRRYEGVWAANRGLFTFWEEENAFGESWKRAPAADLVVNVVVRDVWERSRLPKDVLEEVWDLVASSRDSQALQRDQFVVGLWLIDQRLKGRKLPVRVSSDVWNSVRHTQGVKISRKPY